jgi:ketosteroid isomerase-like protein
MSQDIAARIDRIESEQAIRHLAQRYALAIDMRDIDAIVNLYVEDVKVTRETSGRQALKHSFDTVLRSFRASVHHVGTHVIDFDDADNAHGICYCRCEHEVGDTWVPVYLYYLDLYTRVDGRWYIKRRNPSELYGADSLQRPQANVIDWPGVGVRGGTWHAHFPSWDEFWADPGNAEVPVRAEAPPEGFIDALRRGNRKVVPMDFGFAARKG